MTNKNDFTNFIKELAKIAIDSDLSEIDFKQDEVHIKISRKREVAPIIQNVPYAPAQQMSQVQTQAPSLIPNVLSTPESDFANHSGAVKSPMVGVAYLSPNPDAPDFVSVGSTVNIGDTILLIEAMKVFSPVKAPMAGTVKQVLVKSGEAVEFDEVLVIIE